METALSCHAKEVKTLLCYSLRCGCSCFYCALRYIIDCFCDAVALNEK